MTQNPLDPYWPQLSVWDRFRIGLLFPIGIVRVLLFILALVLYVFCLVVVSFCGDAATKFFLWWTTKPASHVLLFFAGFSVSVNGWENYDAARKTIKGPLLIVMNHVSLIDGFLCNCLFSTPSFILRQDMLKWPIIGPLVRNAHCVGVPQQRRQSSKEQSSSPSTCSSDCKTNKQTSSITDSSGSAIERISAYLNNDQNKGYPLVLFPEGSVSNGCSILRFRTGALTTGHSVLPVAISYDTSAGYKCGFLGSSLCEILAINFIPLFVDSGKKITVTILPQVNILARKRVHDEEIKADDHNSNDSMYIRARLFADTLQRNMAETLGIRALTVTASEAKKAKRAQTNGN